MFLITIIAIGIAANIDNLGISMAYGLRSNRIPFVYNLIISIISMGAAYLSIIAGNILSNYMALSFSNLIGGILLVALGLWVSLKSPDCSEDAKKFATINWKESIILGFILALNCISIGFSAGITGAPPLSTAISVGFFSFISISIGIRLGHKIGKTFFGKHAERIGGLLLILIGIYEIFL
ncbi:manganese efflux pump MntP [Sporosarcina highlanderae]|uniref:Manganese efflux pump n=1 Tax=Sporosarcina highlanderae TaxID=3035916 RepID=A0ABT8JS95_9BACL|nr:manganese efflux pump [Sporosarcina highlanderae]MDN4608045.1 manganese efflux pump [Sporosarcina highlanderae]